MTAPSFRPASSVSALGACSGSSCQWWFQNRRTICGQPGSPTQRRVCIMGLQTTAWSCRRYIKASNS
eukprot:10929621-Prorocentrum_lima.AAC.1